MDSQVARIKEDPEKRKRKLGMARSISYWEEVLMLPRSWGAGEDREGAAGCLDPEGSLDYSQLPPEPEFLAGGCAAGLGM